MHKAKYVQLEAIKTGLAQLFGSDISPVEGAPKEVCIETTKYLHGVNCFGYTAKYDTGTWSITVCVGAKIQLTLRWGDAEKTMWIDDCIKGLYEHKGSLDVYSKTNKVFYCAVERSA